MTASTPMDILSLLSQLGPIIVFATPDGGYRVEQTNQWPVIRQDGD
jgi:hypothetical protein